MDSLRQPPTKNSLCGLDIVERTIYKNEQFTEEIVREQLGKISPAESN